MHTNSSPQSFVDDPAFGAELDELDRGLTDFEPPEAAPPASDQPPPTPLLRRLREMSSAAHSVSVSEPVATAVSVLDSVPDAVPDSFLDSVPDSIFVRQPRGDDDDGNRPLEALPADPAFFERLGTTLDGLDRLATRSRGASVADELGIPERVPPPGEAFSDDDQDQTVTGASTLSLLVTRTAHVAMFIACMGLGGLAAALVFHDRLAQLQLF